MGRKRTYTDDQRVRARNRYRAKIDAMSPDELTEFRKEQRDRSKRFAEAHPDYSRAAKKKFVERHGAVAVGLANTLKIPISDAAALSESMPSSCYICGLELKLCYDHDHTTGDHRGWLCQNCNKGLGNFKDNPKLLEAALRYLNA